MLSASNAASLANSAALSEGSTARLELFFGIMALIALVTMWAWLYFRTRRPTQPPEPPGDSAS